MDNIKYIGIDQSYTSSGVVVLDSVGDIVTSERIVSDKAVDIYARAWYIGKRIGQIAASHVPCYVGIEGLAFGMRGDATRDLAGLLFTVINELRFSNLLQGPVEVVTPLSVKKFATGSGKAKKPEMLEALPEKIKNHFVHDLGYKKTTGLLDMTDAYWIAAYIRSEQKRT